MLALRAVGLEQLAAVRADRLQHSELRFVEIARALMLRPAFLLLDEPAAGLSAEEIRRLGELIKAISRARHRRAAGGAPRRPDLRHLRPRDRAQSRQGAGRRHPRRNPRASGGRQCLPRRLSRCFESRPAAGYGKIGVLHDIALTISAGEAVALLGPNGAGKTTLLRAIRACCPGRRRSSVRRPGHAGASPRETARAGLVHVIEGHRVFTQLSVFDNLLLAGYGMPRARSRGAGRGGAGLLSRDRRQAQ